MPIYTDASTLGQEVQVETKKSKSQEKNEELKLNYSEGLDKATRLSLWETINSERSAYPDLLPLEGGKFASEVFKFVRNIIKFRNHPENINNKHYHRNSSFAERAAGFLVNNIGEDYSETKKFDNFVCVDKYIFTEDGKPIRRVEIHYGALETKADNKFVDEILEDPEKFLKERLLIEKKGGEDLDLRFVFHIPKDSENDGGLKNKVSTKSTKMMTDFITNYKSGDDTTQIRLDAEVRKMPINTNTFKVLDENIDHFKRRETVGRHPSEHYMEIRKPTVEKAIQEIVNSLPEDSNLRRIISSNLEEFTNIVYENIRSYYKTDLDWSGYIFEAAVALELKTDSELSKSINQYVGVAQRKNGETLDFSSIDYQQLSNNYRKRQSEKSLHHADGIITLNEESEDNKKRRKIIGLYECKTSLRTKLHEDTKSQLYKQVEKLKEYLDYYNKFHDDQLTSIPENLINVVLIKPTLDSSERKSFFVPHIQGRLLTVLRSEVTSSDLEMVNYVLNKQNEQSDETPRATVNDVQV